VNYGQKSFIKLGPDPDLRGDHVRQEPDQDSSQGPGNKSGI